LEQLEGILRDVAEELTAWRTRALKAEADARGRGGALVSGAGAGGGTGGARVAELDAENRALRQRVDAARTRVQGLVQRLAFLEEQARAAAGAAGAAGGVSGAAGAAS
jgi:hypothetical protein